MAAMAEPVPGGVRACSGPDTGTASGNSAENPVIPDSRPGKSNIIPNPIVPTRASGILKRTLQLEHGRIRAPGGSFLREIGTVEFLCVLSKQKIRWRFALSEGIWLRSLLFKRRCGCLLQLQVTMRQILAKDAEKLKKRRSFWEDCRRKNFGNWISSSECCSWGAQYYP